MSLQSLPARDKSGYLSEATIAALTTAPGGAINVLRVSGPGAFDAVNRIANRRIQDGEPRKLYRVRLLSSADSWVDDALWVRFVSPESFTGEDVVELHLHGSSFIAHQALELLAKNGVRQALPGEFSFRAVRNGKISISQAQAIADLIAATNENATQLALEKLSGTQNRLITELAANLRSLTAMSELGIDFADQDVEEVSLPFLRRKLSPIQTTLSRLKDSYNRGSRVQDGIRVVFVGLPNSGKSSFFNALLGEDRSIVSDAAGTTRDIIRERITLQGTTKTLTLRIEDTAGLRNTSEEGDPVETMGIARTEKAARDADIILFLVDPTSNPGAALEQWRRIGAPGDKTLGIVTKSDLITPQIRSGLTQLIASFGIKQWIETSSITGAGIDQTTEAIIDLSQSWTHRDPQEVLLTRLDHLNAVSGALEHLGRASAVSGIDLFSADLRQALHSLAPLIGDTLPDDILGKIFADFCIGK